MARPLFNRIVTAVTSYDLFFHNNTDCIGREGISPLIKCTSAIRQLAYGVNGNFLDEYMQISERSSRMALDYFCEAVMKIYGLEFLRKPTTRSCSNSFILLEAVASQDLWIWHAFFGVDGLNNDINVLYQSSLFYDLKTGRAPEIPFVANGVCYSSGYYLVDGIYPKLASLVKTIPEPTDYDNKRILYKSRNRQGKMWNEPAIHQFAYGSTADMFDEYFLQMTGANNDINVLDNSSLFDDLLDDLAPVVDGVEYRNGPNGKLIHNSILNDPYVKRMIPKPGDANRETILLGLPEDIYAAVDSYETAQEIWLRVQQMMKGSDIGIQEKKAKLFNEWERFASNEGESTEFYYHCFLKLMNDLKRNKHFPKKIASNLKFLNNLQLEWSRHVTIVHQTKDLYTADYTQLYEFLKYNQKEVDELKAERLAKTQDPLALMANSKNPYAFLAPHQDQSSFNQNYLQQPMPNPEDITDLTTAINMALALMAKAFKLNYSTPNNNQRISSNPRNR
nr:Gag-Pol polyprotein [Tanacetum cinerariifolium]